MISLAEAQARLLALAPNAADRAEELTIAAAANRFSLTALLARRNQPEHDLSAMDGYAVSGSGPWRVIGESAAGSPFDGALHTGETVRIFTGAIVPDGATCVVMQEDIARDGAMTSLSTAIPLTHGRHIRPKCGDFGTGETLIEAGDRMTAARIGLAIAGGHSRISVARPVRVAIISTGNELVPAGETTEKGQIPASNGPMLAALLQGPGVDVTDCGIVADNLEATKAAIAAASEADLIITIGGASVGDHDLVRPALLALGADIDFWKVAMKPGKPLMAGRLGPAIVLGLPGNPVSAYVTAILFAKPVIATMAGDPAPLPHFHPMPLGTSLPANGNRTDHLRAQLVDGQVTPVGVNDSAALMALSNASHLIVRPAGAPALAAGESVDVLDLA